MHHSTKKGYHGNKGYFPTCQIKAPVWQTFTHNSNPTGFERQRV